MKLAKLVDPQFQASLRKLAAENIPLRTAFTLRGVIKRANEELTKYDEVRSEALKRLGNKDDSGGLAVDDNGSVKLEDENMKQFVSELNALLASDIEVGSVKITDLGDKLNLSTNDLMLLDEVITE